MSDIIKILDTIDNFKDYQIEWLRGHCDIDLGDELEDLIIRFLEDTASCYREEFLFNEIQRMKNE